MEKKIHALTTKLEACLHTECSMRETCLRAMIYPERLEQEDEIIIVNPSRAKVDSSECPYYQTWETVTMAYGFLHLIDLLPKGIFEEARYQLLGYLGEKPYYAKRKGKQPLTPEEQQYIIKVFTDLGFSLPEGATWFDSYAEEYRLQQ